MRFRKGDPKYTGWYLVLSNAGEAWVWWDADKKEWERPPKMYAGFDWKVEKYLYGENKRSSKKKCVVAFFSGIYQHFHSLFRCIIKSRNGKEGT